MYIYIIVYIYIYNCTCMHTYIYIYMCVCVCVCVYLIAWIYIASRYESYSWLFSYFWLDFLAYICLWTRNISRNLPVVIKPLFCQPLLKSSEESWLNLHLSLMSRSAAFSQHSLNFLSQEEAGDFQPISIPFTTEWIS